MPFYDELAKFPAMPSFISRRERSVRTIGTFTLGRLIRMFISKRGPADMKHYYDFNLFTFCMVILANLQSYRRRYARVSMQPLYDMVIEHSSNEPGTSS